MTLIRNLLGTNASGDAQNVEDVFSTYLYEGNGAIQGIDNGINLGDFGVGTSTDFDGTNDYLQKSSDFTGNADGKTFTFSAWIYKPNGGLHLYSTSGGSTNYGMTVSINSSERISIDLQDSSGSNILGTYSSASSYATPNDTWFHLLISLNTGTQTFAVYLNDIVQTGWTTTWLSTADINFTNTQHDIAQYRTGSVKSEARLSHVFLDYTYRNLSTASNRRLFIDANGGSTPPSTLSALNPIMYLPMTDGYTIGENLGTGGDFTSNGSPTIVNKGTEYVAGSGEGGMVWFKNRDEAQDHALFDTSRGAFQYLFSNSTDASWDGTANGISTFNSSGFSVNGGDGYVVNDNGDSIASWTFRKAPRFFDVVTYTGDGNDNRVIPHDLGVRYGMVFVKRTDTTSNWFVYHKQNDFGYNNCHYQYLNTVDATAYATMPFQTSIGNNDNDNTANFIVRTPANVSGGTYVAYLFAHDPDGEDDDGMIACGSYSGDGTTDGSHLVNLGWEPQYVLIKVSSRVGDWFIWDTMRGMVVGYGDALMAANSAAQENATYDWISPDPRGFRLHDNYYGINGSGETYIYMAIRAPMMVEPESGTEVFAQDTSNSTGDNKEPAYRAPFPVDMAINSETSGNHHEISSRLTQGKLMYTNLTNAEVSSSWMKYDYSRGWFYTTNTTSQESFKHSHMFKRAKGFFDVVAYTGNGPSNHDVNHSLGVVPEMIIVKPRDAINHWICYHSELGATKYLHLSLTSSQATNDFAWGDTEPSATTFRVDNGVNASGSVNANNSTYIAYLFATLDGISKVGSYTGNGTNQNIACGFSAGARFVLIKRTDSTGDWYLWDTERGIVTGNDPHLSLNTTAAEVTSDDSIDPQSAGFTVNQVAATNINVTSATYIFMAIA
jgi:hypothetical protein